MLCLVVFVVSLGYAQSKTNVDSLIINSNEPSYSKLIFLSDCEKAKDIAALDIVTNNMKLFIVGGIAPIVCLNDDQFERKYRIEYYDYGCNSPDNKCLQFYNNTIFQHLYKMYGKNWIPKVRLDVEGLKEYKRKR